MTYLGKTLWPANLVPIYPLNPLASSWPALAAAVLLALITATAAWFAHRGRRWLVVAWLWYLITLLPTIGLVQVGMQVMADRFLYLPQIGLCLAAAWLLAELAGRSVARQVALSAAALIAVLALAACAAHRPHFGMMIWPSGSAR